MIKKKIIIKGLKVKSVAYRPFLLDIADSELLPNFDVKNKEEIDEDGNEIVEVFVGGEEEQVNNFIEFIKDFKRNKPKKAIIGSVEVVDDDYKRNIRTTESFSRWLANDQLYKFAEIGTIMLGKQDIMIEKQDETIKEIRDGFGDMTKRQEETIEEIRDLRGDLKSYFDSRISKLEKDIYQIKKKIKIT